MFTFNSAHTWSNRLLKSAILPGRKRPEREEWANWQLREDAGFLFRHSPSPEAKDKWSQNKTYLSAVWVILTCVLGICVSCYFKFLRLFLNQKACKHLTHQSPATFFFLELSLKFAGLLCFEFNINAFKGFFNWIGFHYLFQQKIPHQLAEVGKTDDIKSVNNIFGSPVSDWKEVERVDWCMKCEKS